MAPADCTPPLVADLSGGQAPPIAFGSGGRLFRKTIAGLSIVAVGCATRAPDERPVAATLPVPSAFRTTGSVELDLPPQMAAEAGVPPMLHATFRVDLDARAIGAAPLRSRSDAQLSLLVTADGLDRPLAKVEVSVGGESAGAPDEVLTRTMEQLAKAAVLASRALPPATSRPVR